MQGEKHPLTRHIVAAYDASKLGYSLGQWLLFLQELFLVADKENLSVSDICICDENYQFDSEGGANEKVPDYFEDVLDYFGCRDLIRYKGIDTINNGRLVRIWPSDREYLDGTFLPDSTLNIQKLIDTIPSPFNRRIRKENHTGKFFETLVCSRGKLANVAVHLKQTNSEPNTSNASLNEWEAAIRQFSGSLNFFLIGNDVKDDRFKDMANVYSIDNKDPQIIRDLSIIDSCDFFIGMMSGPCNHVIFSPKPYVIFKNELHHVSEMVKEIGSNDHYPFAAAYQKVIRKNENSELIVRYLEFLIEGIGLGGGANGT